MKNKNIFTQFKRCILLTLLFVGYIGFAQCISSPTLIKSYTVSAKGAGVAGLPSISFDVPQTGTGKRFLMLFMTFERDHTPSPYGDNKESTLTGTVGDNINLMPNVKYGGVNMTKGTFLSSADQASGHRYEDAYTYLSICNYMYFLPESSLPSGNNSFDLSAFSLPKNAGDEVKITVALFDYVKGIDKTKYGNYDFYDVGYVNSWSYESPNNLTTYSLTANMLSSNQPSGVTADKNVLLAYGTNSSQTGFAINGTTWTQLEASSVSNSSGTYASDSHATSGTSENDGFSTALYSLTGVTGNQTIKFNTNSTKKTLGGLLMMRLYGDAFTAPSVQNLTNTCPSTTVNLNNAHTGTIPTGAELRWYTNNSHTGTALTAAQIATVGAGTYYAFYYSNNCWSPASTAVTVTINTCVPSPSCDNLYLISESRNAIYDISSLSGGSLTSTSTNKVMNVSTGANASLAVGIDPNGSGQNIWVTTKYSSSGYVYVNNTATSVTSPGYGGLTANPVDGKVYSVKGGASNARKLYQVYPSYQELGTITGDTFFHKSTTYISTDSFFDTDGKYYLIAYSAILDTSTNTYISTTKRLYSIDLNTRQATFVRAITGIPSSVNAIQGLAFYNDKIYLLYQSSTSTNARLYEINPDTGAGSLKTTYVYPTGGDMDLASCQVYNPPHTVGAPPVQDLANDCPLTTVNLEDAHTGTTPSGSELRWFTNNTHTGTALTAAQIATAGAGIYYAFYYDSNGVYSPASVAVTVTIDDCPDCTNSGETSVNLNDMFTGTLPHTDVELQWWTTPDRQTGTQVADPTNVTASGTYYAFFYDTVNHCYNTDNSTAFVNVTILPPCDTTCTKPGDFSEVGIPTKVGITVQKKQNNWPESIPNGFITLESKEKGFVITRVPHVGGTTGSPDFDDAIEEPREGMLVYDIQDKCVKLFNGEKWKCIEKSCNTAEFTLHCSDVTVSGNTHGPAVNFTITLPYSNGDGATYAQQIMNSIDSLGLSGLTATLSEGTLANGNGAFVISVSGNVVGLNGGPAYFQFEINGHSCLIVSYITMDVQGV